KFRNPPGRVFRYPLCGAQTPPRNALLARILEIIILSEKRFLKRFGPGFQKKNAFVNFLCENYFFNLFLWKIEFCSCSQSEI
ncbi:MAG: hypothetical protein MJZ76_10070, partial [Bacteroidales bacterium]|nr:hypothetical protein [Bacteroidales bacterium]